MDPDLYEYLTMHYKTVQRMIEEHKNAISFIEYIIKGYLYTGKKVTIKGTTLDLVTPVGSYGHLVRHEGQVDEWNFYIEGAERINKYTYVLTIPAEETKRIYDNVKAIEPPKWNVYLQGGAALPIDTFADDYSFGANGIFGFGYNIIREVSVNLLFGYNYLFAASSPSDNIHFISLSLNARLQKIFNNTFGLYTSAGPTIFSDQTFSDIKFGANAGLGIDYRLSHNILLEAGADYFYILDLTTPSQYVHGHAGFVFRF
jgi:hypothetical protein